MRRGSKSAAQTPSPKKDRIYGSKRNPKGSASSSKSASKIKLSESIINTLENKRDEYNAKHPNKKVTLATLKAVFRRGAGAFSSSHRPNMSRSGWAFARVNKFLLKKGGTKVKAAYVQDDDLMERGGIFHSIDPYGQVKSLIEEGVVDLKFYETTPEHAKEYGIQANKPLYVQNLIVLEKERLKGIGKKVLHHLENYANENGNDIIFGYLSDKSSFSRDLRQSFYSDIDLIKNWLHNNGYSINNDTNDFHKVLKTNIRYENGGLTKSLDMAMSNLKKNGIVLKDNNETITLIAYNTGNQERESTLYNKSLIYQSVKPIKSANDIIQNFDLQDFAKFNESKIADYKKSHLIILNQNEVVYDSKNPDIRYAGGGETGQEITCRRCLWTWNTSNSDEHDKYVCHKCGFDNTTYYNSDPMGYKKGGMLKRPHSINLIAIKHSKKIEEVIKALEEGTKIEKEHTKNDSIAKTIAQHHLWESIDYYKKLKEMEKSFELGGEQEEYSHKDYIENEREEISEVLNADDLRISKFLICKAKYELAKNKENTTFDEEDANLWNYVKILWLDAMRKVSDKKYEHDGNVENRKSLHQIYTYEKGGLAYGNSHAKGGIPLLNKGTNSKIEIEGGEGVINKRSMQMNDKMEFEGEKLTPCQIISKINQKGGGVKFKCSDVVDIIKNDGKYK